MLELKKDFLSRDIQDPNAVFPSLHDYLRKCNDLWMNNNTMYVAPYFSMFQSSGYGKSTLLRELGKKYFEVYLSFAPPDSSAIPPRSVPATHLLAQPGQLENLTQTFENFILICLKEIQQTKLSPAEWFNASIQDTSFWNPILEQLTESVSKKKWLQKDNAFLKGIQLNRLVVFAFDEARGLLTPNVNGVSFFRLMRRALASVGQK